MSVLSEEWRDIPGYENRYQVSDLGNVRSIGIGGNGKRGQLLKAMTCTPGLAYVQVALYRNGERRHYRVHQLVMLVFDGPCPDGQEVNHLDGDGSNNHRDNLEYATRSRQMEHAFSIGRRSNEGAKNPAALLTSDQARDIYRRFHAREATGRALAVEYGVSPAAISDIAVRKSWRSLWQS